MNRRTLLPIAAAALAILPAAHAQPVVPSPLSAVAGDAVREVRLDPARLAALRAATGPVRLTGFPMPRGRSVDLELEPFEVLTPDAEIVVGDKEGDLPIGRPDVALFRGTIRGEPDSRVYLSFSDLGPNGLVQVGDETIVLSSGGFGAGGPALIANLADFPEPPEFAKGWECHVGPGHVNPLGLDLDAVISPGDERANPCRIARIAIDSDFEYTAWRFGGDVDASAAYAVTLLGAVSEIYTRDLNVRLVVPYIRVWDADVDPYSGGNLDLFRAEWNANMRHVQRELAHMLSGNYGGGVAWVSVLCSGNYGYGLSGVDGSFPYPLRDHDGGNWDLMVVAHELGHNFGTLHTHDGYNPVIDGCGNGDCSLAWGGTIMSYCHTCAGGMTNIVLAFHPRVITQISGYLQSACNILGDSRAFAYDDEGVAAENTPTRIDVLANDLAINCATPGIFSVQPNTNQGGRAAISPGTGPGGRDEILFTPAPGFVGVDSMLYIMETDTGAFAQAYARVDVVEIRPPEQLGASRPGVSVDYYAIQTTDRLPDFSLLNSYASDLLPAIDYPSSNGRFATSGRADLVGAVFDGLVHVPEQGLFTLFLESDDGSRLLLDDQVVIDNDGLHGMTERSGSIGLAAGWHRVRIEFFERLGDQGLIARIQGPGLSKQVIPASMWRSDRCVGDWTIDGDVNTIDVLFFLSDWNRRDASTDLDGNGVSNTADVIAFLSSWAAGC